MNPGEHQDEHDQEHEPRQSAQEGLFDAQLSFSAPAFVSGPFVEAPQPVKNIVKRDGRLEPFDKNKISDTIFRAAAAIGGNDRERAISLASAVAIYLSKTLAGETPTVDQVGDAVEKVLIEMGHARTALTYARYRDRRARIRKLRQGDTQAILNEIAEARRDPAGLESLAGREPPAGFVRTGSDELKEWDRARIVEALVRETGLEEEIAHLIAVEVEQQLAAANVTTLTSGLVREMVNAKLIERGFESHWRRHVRLGVPLYDAKRIICGLNSDATPLDPERTSQILAESVKREFALSQVFTADVGNSHMRGDLYLHDLGHIDRLHSASPSPGSIARFGVGLPDSRAFSRPPKYADTFLAQMVNSSAALQSHFSGGLTWDALNIHFAPFLDGADDRALAQIAQMLIYEYAYRAAVQGENAPLTAINIYWDAPPYLKRVHATAPGGDIADKTYGDYERTFQNLARALFDVYKEGGVRGVPFTSPSPCVHITPDFWRSPGHEAFLEHVAEVAALRGNVLFAFERTGGDAPAPWEAREVVVQRVTLNLPRLAYKARNIGAFFSDLDHVAGVAAKAHVQKSAFVHRLLSFEALGPLGLLAVRRDGQPALDMQKAQYLVGVCGLAECVAAVTKSRFDESDESMAFAVEILSRLQSACAEASESTGLNILPAQSAHAAVARRFAAIDLQAWRAQTSEVLEPAETEEPAYTPGARIESVRDVTPIERVRIEGRLHPFLHPDAVSEVRMPDTETSPKSVADFIRKAYHQTEARKILITASQTLPFGTV